jgi:hypothetical protein
VIRKSAQARAGSRLGVGRSSSDPFIALTSQDAGECGLPELIKMRP